jgi:hypothetical protein
MNQKWIERNKDSCILIGGSQTTQCTTRFNERGEPTASYR